MCLCLQVRALAEALRDAQNMIALKDRSGGWRNPLADAEECRRQDGPAAGAQDADIEVHEFL